MADVQLLKPRANRSRSRYTVDLPSVLDQRRANLAAEHNLSKADVIRDAVRLLIEYDTLKKEGFQTGGWKTDGDGSRETVKISIGI